MTCLHMCPIDPMALCMRYLGVFNISYDQVPVHQQYSATSHSSMIMVLDMLISERLNQTGHSDPLHRICALFAGICVHWTKGKDFFEILQAQAAQKL